jgi:hypothetical protein
VIHGSYSSVWIYFGGPLLGAALAAGLVHLLGGRLRPLAAKLFSRPAIREHLPGRPADDHAVIACSRGAGDVERRETIGVKEP